LKRGRSSEKFEQAMSTETNNYFYRYEKLVVCSSPKRANWQHKRNTDTFAKKRKKNQNGECTDRQIE